MADTLKKSLDVVLPSAYALAMYFNVSSNRITGNEILITAIHSVRFNGVIWNTL